jgi:hypothetical protein
MPADDATGSLTGVWHGLYSYPLELEPGAFVATQNQSGAHVGGAVHETVAVFGGPPETLFAHVDGSREGSALSFTKTYDGSGGWDHSVFYQGLLSGEGDEIEGRWTVPGQWSGRFLMVRASRRTEAEARRRFERA